MQGLYKHGLRLKAIETPHKLGGKGCVLNQFPQEHLRGQLFLNSRQLY